MVTKRKPRDTFADPRFEDAKPTVDSWIQGFDSDPLLEQLKTWDEDRQVFRQRPVPESACVALPNDEKWRARVGEGAWLAGQDTMMSPGGQVSQLAAYRAELMGKGYFGQSFIGLGSTDYMELLRVANYMLVHNPLAKNVIRALTYLTVGSGVTVTWPGDFNGSGSRREAAWKKVEKATKFQRQIRRITAMSFGLGEWYVIPVVATGATSKTPTRLLHIEPDRVEQIIVNESDAEDVLAYRIKGVDSKLVGKLAKDVIHAKVEDYGNVPRGISCLLPALKYLRYAELFIEGRHYLNLTRSRIPVVRKMQGSTTQIQREKNRFTKLPPPGSIAFDPTNADWQFPEMKINASDASDDWLRIILCIAAAVGLPAHMVANDVSQGTYASTLISESPTIRMIEDYRQFAVETWLSELVERFSGQDDGYAISFAPVIRRSIGELAQAVAVLVDREVISRRTGCETVGHDWDGEDGEQARIEHEREQGFGTGASGSLFGVGPGLADPDEIEPADATLPNERKPEPKTGAALGASGSKLPKKSAG